MKELLQNFLKCSEESHSNIIYVQMYQGNELKAEYQRFPMKTRLNVWSVAKPFVSMGTGIALKERLISLDELIYTAFEEYFPIHPSEYLYQITVRDLLTMSSGIEEPLFFCDGEERYRIKDWIRYFFHQGHFCHSPGTHFCYSNFNCYILSAMIEQRAGANLLNYLRYRLFEPLGIGNPDWTLCPMGHCMAANGLYLTIDELSRFGQMLLNLGEYDGRQIVPKEYVQAARSTQIRTDANDECSVESDGYGYFIRISPVPNSIMMLGNYGQACHVDYSNQTVVSVMSLDGDNHQKIQSDLVYAIRDYYG
ncbi:MAG: serine hydrolase domain-containing protein [Lachnospiraceae bacterium]